MITAILSRPAAAMPVAPRATEPRYAATFVRGEGHDHALAVTIDHLRDRYAELWPAGRRLRSLRGHATTAGPRYTAVWRRSLSAEISVYGVGFDELADRADYLGGYGWRLRQLGAHAAGADAAFTAVWTPGEEPRRHLLAAPADTFSARHVDLYRRGWRLLDLSVHLAGSGEPRYTALWRPGGGLEILEHGLSEPVFATRHAQLWVAGWRLKLLAPYRSGGRLRYTAAWFRSGHPEVQLPSATAAEIGEQAGALRSHGWRLRSLDPIAG